MLPSLDSRDTRAIIQQLKEMLPFYTPEWRFSLEDPDAGTALLLIFTRMLEGTIKRFNQVPRRNLAAFLNMMDISLLPACPASAFLTFRLSSKDTEAVLVPAGTQALAAAAGGEQIVFETENNLLVTPAEPTAIFSSSGSYDRIVEIPAAALIETPDLPGQEYPLLDCFQGENLQEHCFFLGESDLLNIGWKARLEIEILHSQQQFRERLDCQLLVNPEYTEWFYRSADSWQTFSRVTSQTNRIILEKQESGQIEASEINGIKNRWLCCRIKSGQIKALTEVAFTTLKMKAASLPGNDDTGLIPDAMFYNDIPLNMTDCFPFGEFFALYDTFYLASQEAFSKRKAMISISFKLIHDPLIMNNDNTQAIKWKLIMKKSDLDEPERPNILILRVVWEYWNGNSWGKLFKGSQYEDVFLHVADQVTIKFQCPDNMQPCMINDQMNYWIRARVLSIFNIYAPNGVYHTPRLEGLQLSYEYGEESLTPTSLVSLNNLEYLDHGSDLKEEDATARPLQDLDLSCPATYLGFATPPLQGPLSIFFSMREQCYDPENTPALDWEYTSQNGYAVQWSKLDVMDRTNHLSNSGLLIFGGPPDFSRLTLFGKNLYWMRVVNYDGKFDQAETRPVIPLAKGLYMNTTQVVQQEAAPVVFISNRGGEAFFSFDLPRTPIIAEEVWVEESSQLDEWEKDLLLNDRNLERRESRDEWGNLQQLWIKWKRVADLGLSEPDDRHYTLDISYGRICFGDNQHGRIPPRSDTNNIEIKYWVGGGSQGNVAAREINLLRNSLPYIDGVFNPRAAFGGCDRESFEEAMRRGPKTLKHAGRGVTCSDLETMVHEVSRNVAQVKCLPNTNGRGQRESGCITLVVLPRGKIAASLTFPALRQEIEKYLYHRISGNLLLADKLHIIEPLYLEISITAILVTDSIDNLIRVETEALNKLSNFFQPESYDHGWNIGEYPYISTLYTLLKSINDVNYIENISMTVNKLSNGERTEIDPNQISHILHGYILNGTHLIKVKARNEKSRR